MLLFQSGVHGALLVMAHPLRSAILRAFSRLDSTKLPLYRVAMPVTLDAVAHDALVLPPDQRLALARQLLESVDLEPEPGAEAAWEAEIGPDPVAADVRRRRSSASLVGVMWKFGRAVHAPACLSGIGRSAHVRAICGACGHSYATVRSFHAQ